MLGDNDAIAKIECSEWAAGKMRELARKQGVDLADPLGLPLSSLTAIPVIVVPELADHIVKIHRRSGAVDTLDLRRRTSCYGLH